MISRLVATLAALALALLAVPVGARPASPSDPVASDAAFQRGLDAYRAGEYGLAAQHWQQCLGDGVRGAARGHVLYDLGNARYRQGRLLDAVGYYEAALELLPRDADLWSNLELARREAGLPPRDRGDLGALVRGVIGSFTPGEARLLALAATLLLAAVLLAEALRGGALLRVVALAVALLALLAWIPFAARALQSDERGLFCVADGGAELRSEPLAERDAIARVPAASRAAELDRMPGWVRVETEDGRVGWTRDGAWLELPVAEPATR